MENFVVEFLQEWSDVADYRVGLCFDTAAFNVRHYHDSTILRSTSTSSAYLRILAIYQSN